MSAEKLLRKELRRKKIAKIRLIKNEYSELCKALCERIVREPVELADEGYYATCLEEFVATELDAFLQDQEGMHQQLLMETIPHSLLQEEAEKLGIKIPSVSGESVELVEKMQQLQPQTKASLRKSFEHLRNENGKEVRKIKKKE